MEIQVRGNGVRINDGLLEFIDRRATRLDRMVDRVVDAKLELRALHNRVGPDTTAAQITIRSGREVLRAEERPRTSSWPSIKLSTSSSARSAVSTTSVPPPCPRSRDDTRWRR